MKLGFVSDSLGGLPFEAMLDHAQRLGVSGVEVNTCGWSTAPHFDLSTILRDKNAQKSFLRAFADRELEVVGLNANGNPLHPTDHGQGQGLEDTIRAAGELGIKTVCAMSGLPAGNAADTMPNWVVSSWPPETPGDRLKTQLPASGRSEYSSTRRRPPQPPRAGRILRVLHGAQE